MGSLPQKKGIKEAMEDPVSDFSLQCLSHTLEKTVNRDVPVGVKAKAECRILCEEELDEIGGSLRPGRADSTRKVGIEDEILSPRRSGG